MAELVLPWPDKSLSPNARVHWAVRAKAARNAKKAAFYGCRESGLVVPETEWKLHVWIDFYPPDKRNRDADNCLASLKSALDGIADALGVNDNRFVCHPWIKDTFEKGGLVKVRITAGPEGH
jgi:Holliday junction resolvase RusA-like endonuclease